MENNVKPSLLFHGFPWPRRTPWELPEEYHFLRDNAPLAQAVFKSGQPVWLVSTYDMVRRVLVSPQVSAEHSNPAFPGVFPVRQKRSEDGERPKLAYSGMDGREHTFHRKLVAADFSRIASDRLRHSIQAAARSQATLYAALNQPADIVTGYSRPLVASVIGQCLGLSLPEIAECATLTDVVLGGGEDRSVSDNASRKLRSIVSSILEKKVATKSDDILGRLVSRYIEAGIYNHDQLNRLATSLITASLETTANMISLSIMTLVRFPDQQRVLRNNMSLLPNAVSELLRFLSVADIVTARVTVDNLDVGGFILPKGTGIVALIASANRDASAFPDPNTFDIKRHADHHLGFGYGAHKCLGQHLARTIVESAIRAFLDQFTSIRFPTTVPNNGKISKRVMCGVDRLELVWDQF